MKVPPSKRKPSRKELQKTKIRKLREGLASLDVEVKELQESLNKETK